MLTGADRPGRARSPSSCARLPRATQRAANTAGAARMTRTASRRTVKRTALCMRRLRVGVSAAKDGRIARGPLRALPRSSRTTRLDVAARVVPGARHAPAAAPVAAMAMLAKVCHVSAVRPRLELAPPGAHCVQQRHQPPAGIGELVVDPRGITLEGGAPDHAGLHQPAQFAAEDAVRDGRVVAAKF